MNSVLREPATLTPFRLGVVCPKALGTDLAWIAVRSVKAQASTGRRLP
jgi:hypothetical protein